MEFSLEKFLLIMIIMAFANMSGTLYFCNVEKKKAHTAAFWSAMLILINAFAIIHYVENSIYIAAAFIGTYVGTFGTLKWEQKTERN